MITENTTIAELEEMAVKLEITSIEIRGTAGGFFATAQLKNDGGEARRFGHSISQAIARVFESVSFDTASQGIP